MGFFGMDDKPEPSARVKGQPKGVQLSTLHAQGCNMCPLNDAACKHPKMKPNGTKQADVYILGTAPSVIDDKQGKPFSDEAGRYVRARVPAPWKDHVRYGNVIKTHPGMGANVESSNRDDKRGYQHVRNPEYIEIECCRPQVRADILRVKPSAVVVIGAVALRWIADETHSYLWQGRRFPASITDGEEEHTFWVYPMTHPYDVMKDRRWDGHVPDSETTWARHFKNVFREIDSIKAPVVLTEKHAMAGVKWVFGDGKADLRTIEKHLEAATQDKINGLDYETSELRPYNDSSKILTGSVTHSGGTLAFPFDHKEALWTPRQRDMLDDMWTEYLCDPGPRKIAHQLAFELEWSAVEFGVETMDSKWGDSISQAYIINEKQGMLALEVLTQQYYGINLKALSNVNRKRMADEPLKRILPYNGMDSKFHRKLFIKQAPLIAEQELEAVYRHQIARIPALVRTQMHGIPVDQNEILKLRGPYEKAQKDALAALKELHCWAKYEKTHGKEFNPGSNHDVKKMLIMIGHAKVGGDEKQLKKMDHPFGKALIKWRKPSKLLSTYCDPVTPGTENCQLMDDGKIHPIISTYKVETWRTSSEDPNIQNWPVRGPNYIIRRIIKKAARKVVKFDYAGIQARAIAMESEDSAFMQAFFDWYDIHSEWSNNFRERMPKWAPAEMDDPKVFKEVRSLIKNGFVFPSFFGAQAKSITVSVNAINGVRKPMPVEVVQELQDDLFDQFPRIKKYQERLKVFYEKNGYVTGLSGFKRRAPISFNQLINSPIQGDESIIVLSAHIALVKRGIIPMMEIHDDLTFLWKHEDVERNSEIVITEMLKHRFDWINVPLVVERAIGDDWASCEKAGEFESVGTDEWREHGGADNVGFGHDAYHTAEGAVLGKKGSVAARRRKAGNGSIRY